MVISVRKSKGRWLAVSSKFTVTQTVFISNLLPPVFIDLINDTLVISPRNLKIISFFPSLPHPDVLKKNPVDCASYLFFKHLLLIFPLSTEPHNAFMGQYIHLVSLSPEGTVKTLCTCKVEPLLYGT